MSTGTMSSFSNGFHEIDDMFLEFNDTLNNAKLSLVDDTSG